MSAAFLHLRACELNLRWKEKATESNNSISSKAPQDLQDKFLVFDIQVRLEKFPKSPPGKI